MCAQIIDARVKQKTGTAADFAGYQLLAGEIALVRTSPNGPVWNFKVGPGNFDSLDWSLQNPGAAQKADTSTVFPVGVPGLYIPTESGTYEGLTVDLSAGYTQLIWDGASLVDVVFPINLAGYATVSSVEQVEFDLATTNNNVVALQGSVSGLESDVTGLQNTKENTANKSTIINDSDTEFPTSRAVLDYVATFAGASYGGNVTPEDVPTPSGNLWWSATEPGVYTYFGGVVLAENSIGIISRIDGVYTVSNVPVDPNPPVFGDSFFEL